MCFIYIRIKIGWIKSYARRFSKHEYWNFNNDKKHIVRVIRCAHLWMTKVDLNRTPIFFLKQIDWFYNRFIKFQVQVQFFFKNKQFFADHWRKKWDSIFIKPHILSKWSIHFRLNLILIDWPANWCVIQNDNFYWLLNIRYMLLLMVVTVQQITENHHESQVYDNIFINLFFLFK